MIKSNGDSLAGSQVAENIHESHTVDPPLYFHIAKKSHKPAKILLVEDNPADIDLLVEAFKESSFTYHLRMARDGVETLKYLRRQGQYSNATSPDLIILDLNLPKKDGRAVLAELKQNTVLKRIPVIVLSMSQADEDILMSYELNANCFINKPIDLNEFIKVARSIKDFWLNTVKLPPEWGTVQ